jgi:hypothetical protein
LPLATMSAAGLPPADIAAGRLGGIGAAIIRSAIALRRLEGAPLQARSCR